MHTSAHQLVWLAADYHLPGTYSCRVPMSSMSSARALPAPGPATIRLALVRTGIELFGLEYTRNTLFPVIRAAEIAIRPPACVAFSLQRIRAYKASPAGPRAVDRLDESITYREFAHAAGPMTVYINVPTQCTEAVREMLMAIGYWGQASSLAHCVSMEYATPESGQCAVPLRLLDEMQSVQKFVSCLVAELRDSEVTWEEITPEVHLERTDAIRLELYLWPMVIIEQRGGSRVLLRRSISTPEVLTTKQT
jgi:hypothetical protein